MNLGTKECLKLYTLYTINKLPELVGKGEYIDFKGTHFFTVEPINEELKVEVENLYAKYVDLNKKHT